MAPRPAQQHIFLLGKGGVGKSTAAALLGICLADSGKRVLLASLDPAHNLSDIFERSLGDRAAPLAAGLRGMEVDQARWIKKYLKEVKREIRRTYRYLTAFNLDDYLEVMRFAPGLEEYALVLAFRHIIKRHADCDYLIFDMPPTALSLRFFGLPALSLVWIDALRKMRLEIIRKKEMITRIRLGKMEIEQDKVLQRIEERQADYTALRRLFTDGARTRMNLVLNPDRLSSSESQRIVQTLAGLGMTVSRVIVNHTRPGMPDACLHADLTSLPTVVLPCASEPLTGLARLRHFLQHQCAGFGTML